MGQKSSKSVAKFKEDKKKYRLLENASDSGSSEITAETLRHLDLDFEIIAGVTVRKADVEVSTIVKETTAEVGNNITTQSITSRHEKTTQTSLPAAALQSPKKNKKKEMPSIEAIRNHLIHGPPIDNEMDDDELGYFHRPNGFRRGRRPCNVIPVHDGTVPSHLRYNRYFYVMFEDCRHLEIISEKHIRQLAPELLDNWRGIWESNPIPVKRMKKGTQKTPSHEISYSFAVLPPEIPI